MTSGYTAKQAEVPQSPLTSGSARFLREGGLARACPGSFWNAGKAEERMNRKQSPWSPGREAVHVGVGDLEGGDAAWRAGGAGSWSSAPPPAPAPASAPAPPSLAALKPAPRAPPVPSFALCTPAPRQSCQSTPSASVPTQSSQSALRCSPGPVSGPALFGVSASREKSSPQASCSRAQGRMGDRGARPGLLMPMLALLSWAAGLGVAEETLARIPAGELSLPFSSSGLEGTGHISSLRASSLRDLTAGFRALRLTGTFFPAPREAACHPASIYKPRLGPD